MLKEIKVLGLSLGIVILGSNATEATGINNNYDNFKDYNVDSNFYDTYTNKNYNYNWDVKVWGNKENNLNSNTPSVPVEKPSAPVEEIPEVETPQAPSSPEEEKPVAPSKPVAPKPESNPQKPTDTSVENTNLSQMELEVVRLVNIEREKNGLSPFTISNELSNVARIKSQDMSVNNYFSHQSPKYGSPFDMMKSFGINYKTAGENIAKGYSSPESVVRGWMNSQGHRENILNGSFNTIGVGAFNSNGTIYWTQMFTN